MSSFQLPGKRVLSGTAETVPAELQGMIEITETHMTSVLAARGEDVDARVEIDGLDDTDIVEIHLEGGIRLWQSVADARADFADAERSVSDQALLVPRVLHFEGDATRRDGGGHVVEAVKVLKTGIASKTGELTAMAVANHIEKSINPGFYRCVRVEDGPLPALELRPVGETTIDPEKPMLVLVHGTFSSTAGSFSDLAGPPYEGSATPSAARDVWAALGAAFPAGIFALEHKTVTVDPIQNAIDLVEALPECARVSLLSHSRGGLIVELIARASREGAEDGIFDDTDFGILDKAGRNLAPLRRLSDALFKKKIVVERVIRVAGPLRGTSLASKRLDRVLSVALNTFELIPVLKFSAAYGLLKSFLIGFVKTKADPEKLPGLEAMMPGSPLVALLNRPDIRLASNLHAITGDNEGEGVYSRLRNLAVDLFFTGDNDFVVNTASMNRGAARAMPSMPTDIITSQITHFNYFRTDGARNAIHAAAHFVPGTQADRDGQTVIRDGSGEDLMIDFQPDAFDVPRARDAANMPVCFFLPGVMGSHLHHSNKPGDTDWIWTNPIRIAAGALERLQVGSAGTVTPGKPINRYYGKLARFLARSHDVVPFAYDWRRSILSLGANELGQGVEAALNRTDKPIRFVAHSMGGLVVRAFIDAHPALWAEIKSRAGSRLVMLGTPNGGAFSMAHTMLGRSKSIKQLALADLEHSKKELLEIVTSMPGPLQLLPSDDGGHYLKHGTWTNLQSIDAEDWVVPSEQVFREARRAHELFGSQPLDPELVCYVAGLGEAPTPSGIRVDHDESGNRKITFLGTRRGDGTVTWATGVPKGIKPYYMDAIHGDMARKTSTFPAILDLLERGETSMLSQTAPVTARDGVDEVVALPEVEIDLYPDPADVFDGFVGATRSKPASRETTAQQIDVTMVHGDLRFARHPVLVGHYANDSISGAEADLDQCLDYHLNQVRELGLYPGAIETCEVVLRLDRNPGGAVVAGLGRFGDLTPGQLRTTIKRAVLRYVLNMQRRILDQGQQITDMEPIALTSLVIGHKSANMTVQQSVQAILEAVAQANDTLRDTTPIAKLEFIEILEDTAFNAASALHRASQNGQMRGLFNFDYRIKSGTGARLRMDFGIEPDSWQRISVTRNKEEGSTLDFTAITDGAKAVFDKTALQTDVIDRLLRVSRKGTAIERNLGKLLFELMIPLDLKAFAQNDQKILLILDEHTAHIPWELMEDDNSTFGEGPYERTDKPEFKPLVVRTPIIRQLVTSGPTVQRASSETALVIADPLDTGLVQLEGARNEGEEVVRRLETDGSFDVTSRIQTENGIEILERIMLYPVKILHIAAHGVLNGGDEQYPDEANSGPRAGLVLSDGIRLTSAELRNMRYVPEFVFLNCCHLGRVEENTGPIAANLSQTLIEKGVRAVISAGWAVDDRAALLFAREFYDSMLNGNRFGDAVHHARMVVFARYPKTNTWGAYQCYGDPDYRFRARNETGHSKAHYAPRFYSAAHAQKAAINIERDVGSVFKKRKELLRDLDAIYDSARPEWHADAEWCEAMGRAYAKLDIYPRAIELLEAAKSQSRSFVTINAIERLESLKVRVATYEWTKAERAWQDAEHGQRTAARAFADDMRRAQRDTAKAALDSLGTLDDLAGSPGKPMLTERRELLKGTVSKRLVLSANTKRMKTNELKKMIAFYERSKDLAAAGKPRYLKHHPTFNWLSGHVALGSAVVAGEPIETVFDRLLAQNVIDEDRNPTFWTAVLPAEIDILRGVLAAPTERDVIFARFEANFRYAWKRGGAFGQARSIREHVHFLKIVCTGQSVEMEAWMTRVQAFLNELTWGYRDDHPEEFSA